jgi:hypothetical protein
MAKLTRQKLIEFLANGGDGPFSPGTDLSGARNESNRRNPHERAFDRGDLRPRHALARRLRSSA